MNFGRSGKRNLIGSVAAISILNNQFVGTGLIRENNFGGIPGAPPVLREILYRGEGNIGVIAKLSVS